MNYEPTNEDRARWGSNALTAYDHAGIDEAVTQFNLDTESDAEDIAADLLADLYHYAFQTGRTFKNVAHFEFAVDLMIWHKDHDPHTPWENVLRRAKTNFEAEVNDALNHTLKGMEWL